MQAERTEESRRAWESPRITLAGHARTLVQAGIEAGILIAPILPGLTDTWTSLANLMEAAREAGAKFASGHALRLGSVTRARFIPLLHDTFPMLAPKYERHYSGRNNTSREYKKALSRRLRLLKEAYGFGDRRIGGSADRRTQEGSE